MNSYIIPPKIKKPRKKKEKSENMSIHRESKIGVHTGKGLIAQLVEKVKKK